MFIRVHSCLESGIDAVTLTRLKLCMAEKGFPLTLRVVTCLNVALLLAACGSTHHFRKTNPTETPSTPPYLELLAEPSAGTLHFPRGLYVLDAVDDNGYYYRAPQSIIQHSFSGSIRRNGGVFVSKRDQRRLRGYVIMSSGLTHVGNFSRVDHEFR